MSSPTCASCLFWIQDNGQNGSARGFCRRQPPAMFPIAVRDRFTGQTSQAFQSQFVMTESGWWCGEHQPEKVNLLEGAQS